MFRTRRGSIVIYRRGTLVFGLDAKAGRTKHTADPDQVQADRRRLIP